MPEDGPASFRPLREEASLKLTMARKVSEGEFVEMARAGFAVNDTEFRGYAPGWLLLNSIALQADGTVKAVLSPLKGPAGDHIRRIDFSALFGV